MKLDILIVVLSSVIVFSDHTQAESDVERVDRSAHEQNRWLWRYVRHISYYRRRCKRERKEIRQMSKVEWKRFTNALKSMKKKGIYDDIAEIHRGEERLGAAHGGPNFLGWHRIYLLVLESWLRQEHPCITIPYWDSTLDYDMKDPTKSVLWTDCFFGNGDLQVTSGPFAHWVTSTGANLTRNIGDDGTLMMKGEIKKIMSRTNHSQILDLSNPDYNIDRIHMGPHVWVDGQLSVFSEAAEDPVFFMHHAFIDCIWYWFQEKIYREHGIDSFNDYPDPGDDELHEPDREMDPFAKMTPYKGIKNRDGYHRRYYKKLYTCKPIPTCSSSHTSCGSPYLKCDTKRKRCVSKEAGEAGYPQRRRHRHRKLPAIGKGRRFISDIIDKRTRGRRRLPQKLPDSNLRAKTIRAILRRLRKDSGINLEATRNKLNVNFNVGKNHDNDDGQYLDIIRAVG